jgi:hypothetical protein
MKISTKGMASSAMPKVAPPIENKVTKSGIRPARTQRERLCALATDLIRASIASVLCSTLKAPPTSSTKPMISEASTKPLIGAVSRATRPCGWDGTRRKESGAMTCLPATVSVSYCPPGTSQVAAAISASSANSSTKVLGRRSFIAVGQRAEGATVPVRPPPSRAGRAGGAALQARVAWPQARAAVRGCDRSRGRPQATQGSARQQAA